MGQNGTGYEMMTQDACHQPRANTPSVALDRRISVPSKSRQANLKDVWPSGEYCFHKPGVIDRRLTFYAFDEHSSVGLFDYYVHVLDANITKECKNESYSYSYFGDIQQTGKYNQSDCIYPLQMDAWVPSDPGVEIKDAYSQNGTGYEMMTQDACHQPRANAYSV